MYSCCRRTVVVMFPLIPSRIVCVLEGRVAEIRRSKANERQINLKSRGPACKSLLQPSTDLQVPALEELVSETGQEKNSCSPFCSKANPLSLCGSKHTHGTGVARTS